MTQKSIVLVNVLRTQPEKQSELIQLLKDNIENVVKSLDGWQDTTAIATTDGNSVVLYSRWASAAAAQAMRTNPAMLAYFPRIRELAEFESFQGSVVL